jgi:acetyl esterase/lipase
MPRLVRSFACAFAVVASMSGALSGAARPQSKAGTTPLSVEPVFTSVDVQQDVVFARVKTTGGGSVDLGLDVYQPAGDTGKARPAVLWIHGGGFKPGTDKRQKYIVALATEFARRGFVSVAPDYRVRQDPKADEMGTLKDAVADCRAAIAWLRSNRETYRVDMGRLVVAGGSAGGKTAVSLVILENADAPKGQQPAVRALIDLWGSPEPTLMLGEVDSRFPPTLIIHGTKDQSVPFALSEALAARLKAAGIEHVLLPIPDAPHTPTDQMDEIVDTTTKFVARILGRQRP